MNNFYLVFCHGENKIVTYDIIKSESLNKAIKIALKTYGSSWKAVFTKEEFANYKLENNDIAFIRNKVLS